MARYAVILAGGGGTRLWPASRRRRPKQFLPLAPGGETLLGATVRRLGAEVPPEQVVVVTAASQVDEVRRAVPALRPENLIVEPTGRNTAPAIALAALALRQRDPQAVLGVLPADHYIGDEAGFARLVGRALALAEERDAVVTLGVRPTHPETGFGYLELEAPARGAGEPVAVRKFVEKPDRSTAEAYLAGGRHLWNSGLFFFRAEKLLALVREHMPELDAVLTRIAAAPAGAARDTVVAAEYPRAPSISIDYGVMEKTGGILCLPADVGWNDVGSFAALADIHRGDADGNVALGEAVTAGGASGNIVIADPGHIVALVGVEGLVVVQAGDAVLVLPKERAQDVREIVSALQKSGRDRYL